jgi:hypothetical protein
LLWNAFGVQCPPASTPAPALEERAGEVATLPRTHTGTSTHTGTGINTHTDTGTNTRIGITNAKGVRTTKGRVGAYPVSPGQ